MLGPEGFSQEHLGFKRKADKKTVGIIDSLPESLQPNEVLRNRLLLLNMRAMSEGGISGENKRNEINLENIKENRETHLDHTNKITLAIDRFSNFFPELEKIKQELKTSALYHDIGKTGDTKDPKVQYCIMRLFSLYEGNKECRISKMTIEEALEIHDREEKDSILKLIDKIGWKGDDLMSKVYQSHVTSSINILTSNNVNPEVIYMAGSHHKIASNYDYTGLPKLKELPEEKHESLEIGRIILELIDFFEAAKYRQKKMPTDENIILMLREKYEKDSKIKVVLDKIEENIEVIVKIFEDYDK